MSKVFVVNKSTHDFTPAERYGDLVFLSSGPMVRFQVNSMARRFWERLKFSEKGDYILLSGLSVMNVVACSIFARLHGRLNLLIYRNGQYYEANTVLDNLIQNLDEEEQGDCHGTTEVCSND